MLLLLVFRGVVAAALPLAVGAVAVLGSFTALRVLTTLTEVSVFAINILTMLGLGLAIDYALFIISRFREDLDGDDLVVVIGAFSTSGISFIKMIGIGMALAIVIDATVVRALLVSATMRLLGPANWWLPGPLARLWARFGLREYDGRPVVVPAGQHTVELPAAAGA